MIDPSQMEMALLNVIGNARDASPEGGEITIATRTIHLNGDAAARQLEPGDYVILSVTDKGVGMPPHIVARAAEPFFTTKSPGEGTGLGLAMVQGFAQQSGGRLEIESQPGVGTTIRMIFPQFTAEEDVETAGRPTGYPTRPIDELARAPPLILVVDDNREIAEMAREALHRHRLPRRGGLQRRRGSQALRSRAGDAATRSAWCSPTC